MALQRVDQRRFFAANERTGSFHDAELHVQVAAQHTIANQTVLLTPLDGFTNPFDRQRIFGANVEDRLAGSDRARGDRHALDDAIRERLEQHAVHECARVAFVAVADDVLRIAGGFLRLLPLDVRRKTAAATPAQSAPAHFVDDRRRIEFVQAASQGHKAIVPQVLVQIQGIQVAAELRGNVLLRSEKRAHGLLANVQRVGDHRVFFFIGLELVQPARQPVAQLSHEPARAEVPQHDVPHILRLHMRKELRIATRRDQLHQRGLMTHADAAHAFHGGRCARFVQHRENLVVDLPLPWAWQQEPSPMRISPRLSGRELADGACDRARASLRPQCLGHNARHTARRHAPVRQRRRSAPREPTCSNPGTPPAGL